MADKTSNLIADFVRFGIFGFLFLILWIAIGFPLAEMAVHGFEVAAWPPEATIPSVWFGNLVSLNWGTIFDEIFRVMTWTHLGFPSGGYEASRVFRRPVRLSHAAISRLFMAA